MAEPLRQTETRGSQLIYRPPPRWYFWTALGAALAIHVTAVAVSQRHEAPPVDLPPQPPQVVEAVLAPPEATPRLKTFPFPSLRLRRRFNRNLSKRGHRHPNNNKRNRNSRQSRARDRCRCRERKLSLSTRRARSTRTRRVHGMSPAVASSSAQWTQVAAASVAVVFRQALGIRFWITPPLARFGSGDLDPEQSRRLTFPSPSP